MNEDLNIDEYLKAGIVCLALVHAGYISINCMDCTDKQKEFYHCNNSGVEPIFEYEDMEFYNCPLKFITPQVIDFYDELCYYKLFPGTAPKYGEHNVRFFNMARIYENTYNANAYKADKPEDKKTDQSLAELRKSFNKRKK